jgi:hypothetical protein
MSQATWRHKHCANTLSPGLQLCLLFDSLEVEVTAPLCRRANARHAKMNPQLSNGLQVPRVSNGAYVCGDEPNTINNLRANEQVPMNKYMVVGIEATCAASSFHRTGHHVRTLVCKSKTAWKICLQPQKIAKSAQHHAQETQAHWRQCRSRNKQGRRAHTPVQTRTDVQTRCPTKKGK